MEPYWHGTIQSATKVITRLPSKVHEKGTESYSEAIISIRTKISFALLRSCVLCLRGCRSTSRQAATESSISAVVLRIQLILESTPFLVGAFSFWGKMPDFYSDLRLTLIGPLFRETPETTKADANLLPMHTYCKGSPFDFFYFLKVTYKTERRLKGLFSTVRLFSNF